MIPAFSAWIESPEPGISTSTTVSAIESTPTSLWPVPTVSRKTTSLPGGVEQRAAPGASPPRGRPRWPRVPIERMKTPGSRKWSVSRIRSPSSAPCVNGLDGSTEITPTVCPSARTWRTSADDEARLADAGRAGEADRVRAPRSAGRASATTLVGERVAVLDERDRAGERARVARADRLDRAALASSRAAPAHATRRSARSQQPARLHAAASDERRRPRSRRRQRAPSGVGQRAGERRTRRRARRS